MRNLVLTLTVTKQKEGGINTSVEVSSYLAKLTDEETKFLFDALEELKGTVEKIRNGEIVVQ